MPAWMHMGPRSKKRLQVLQNDVLRMILVMHDEADIKLVKERLEDTTLSAEKLLLPVKQRLKNRSLAQISVAYYAKLTL